MTKQQLIAYINAWIRDNNSKDITAAIMRDVLDKIVEFIDDNVGEVQDLVEGDSVIGAINLLFQMFEDLDISFPVNKYTGTSDPNINPPPVFNIGDLYVRSGNALYQYNGNSWVRIIDAQAIIELIPEPSDFVSSDVGNQIEIGSDNKLYVAEQVLTAISWGDIFGNIGDQDDLIALLNQYLPLTGGTVNGDITAQMFMSMQNRPSFRWVEEDTNFMLEAYVDNESLIIRDITNDEIRLTISEDGSEFNIPVSASNFESERGIGFIGGIELSRLSSLGVLAIRRKTTGEVLYVFNQTGSPSDPKDLITKEFFDANIQTGSEKITVVTTGGSKNNQEPTTDFIKFTNKVTPTILSGIGVGRDGQEITIWNDTLQSLSLLHNSSSAIVSRRLFNLGEVDIELPVGAKAVYRFGTSIWTMIGVFGAGFEPTLVGSSTRAVSVTNEGVFQDEEIMEMKDWNLGITSNQSNAQLNTLYPEAKQGFIVVCKNNGREYELEDENQGLWIFRTINIV